MLSVSVKINRSISVVWNYFTTTSNWIKWYGAGLKDVVPAWQQGAKLVWELGGDSPIIKFLPEKEICLSGRWMDTTYNFLQEDNSVTIVEVIQSDPKGGAAFTDGGAAEKSKWEKMLQKFKEIVEEESNPASEPLGLVESLILAIRDEPVPMDFDFKSDTKREVAVNKLAEIGIPALEPLISAMNGGELETNVVSPVIYTYYVKALSKIGDPRALKTLTVLQKDVDFKMGLPNLFADLVMPRYKYLYKAIEFALTACSESQKEKSDTPNPVQKIVIQQPIHSKSSQPRTTSLSTIRWTGRIVAGAIFLSLLLLAALSFTSNSSCQYSFQGKDYQLFYVDFPDGTHRDLALVKPGRLQSTFMNPEKPESDLIQWNGNWRVLKKSCSVSNLARLFNK